MTLDLEAVGRTLIQFIGTDASDIDPERFVAKYAALAAEADQETPTTQLVDITGIDHIIRAWLDDPATVDVIARAMEGPVGGWIAQQQGDQAKRRRRFAAALIAAIRHEVAVGVGRPMSGLDVTMPTGWSFSLSPYWADGCWWGWEVETHHETYSFDGDRRLSSGNLGAFQNIDKAIAAAREYAAATR